MFYVRYPLDVKVKPSSSQLAIWIWSSREIWAGDVNLRALGI